MKNFTKFGLSLFALVTLSLIGFSVVRGYGGGYPYMSPAPVITAIEVPMTVGPSQEGSMTNSFGQHGRIFLNVPKETVDSPTTFKSEILTTENPGLSAGQFMPGSKVYNFTAQDSNHQPVINFSKKINITLSVPGLPADVSELGVYWYNTPTKAWYWVPGAKFDHEAGKISFSVDHLTQFAILKIKDTPAIVSAGGKVLGVKIKTQPIKLTNEHLIIFDSGKNLNAIIENSGKKKSAWAQQDGMKRYIAPITNGQSATINQKYAINNFIVYGTKSTVVLSKDERYQVIKLFKDNFRKLPKSQSDWLEVLKISKIIK
jgi:hypothetical protein